MTQLVLNSIITGSLYALVAMSFNLIYGVSRSFNLAHGALGTIAAYTVFFFALEQDIPLIVSIPLGVIAAAVSTLCLELLVFRPLRARRASNLVLLIASLGLMTAIEALIAMLFTSQFKTIAPILPWNPTFPVFGGTLTGVQIVLIVSAVLVFLAFWFMLTRTKFGKALRAIRDDEEVAKIVGIDTNRIIGVTFLLGGAVMGLAGILFSFDVGLEPRMGFLLVLAAAITAIIGGIGSVYGAFVGAFLLGFVENFGVWFTAGQLKYAIAFSVLILFLLFRPQGIFGKK